MKMAPKTIWLFVLASLLLVGNLIDRGTAGREVEQLPMLTALDHTAVRRIEVSTATQKVLLTRQQKTQSGDEGVITEADLGPWMLVAPIEGEADQALVRSLVKVFRKDVSMDVRVDHGNLEDYGLQPGNGIVVEFWTSSEAPAVSFTVGANAPGGSSFVRLSGDDAVFRARLGGRHRYERKPTQWRNKVLMGVETSEVAGLRVQKGQNTSLEIGRAGSVEVDENGNPVPGQWTLVPDPGWDVDQLAIEAVVSRLGTARAGELLGEEYDGGFSPPSAVVEVALVDGTSKKWVIGSRVLDNARFVRLDDGAQVYRVASSSVGVVLVEPSFFKDKTMFVFPRSEVDTFTLEEGSARIVLQQDLSNNLWNVIEPQNVDLDIKLVFFAVNTMASLRAHEVVSDPAVTARSAGLDEPAARVSVRFLDGRSIALELGDATQDSAGRPGIFARRQGEDQIFLLREATVNKLKSGFGRQ